MREFWHVGDGDWFGGLEAGERGRLRADSRVQEHARGDLIFSPTPTPHSVYLLERGRARIYRLSPSGEETTFGFVEPGELFGEFTGFGDFPRESFAEAVEPSATWSIPGPAFRDLLQRHPELAVGITRQIGARFKSLESRVEALVTRDVRARTAAMLLELGERLGRAEGGRITIGVQLTQAEIASLIGATRQSVNECLRAFTSSGWIRRERRHIVIEDPAALRSAAGRPEAAPES
jgi:CRP-like cAMP-binding protein